MKGLTIEEANEILENSVADSLIGRVCIMDDKGEKGWLLFQENCGVKFPFFSPVIIPRNMAEAILDAAISQRSFVFL